MKSILIASIWVGLIFAVLSEQIKKQTPLLKLQLLGPSNESIYILNNLIHQLRYEQFISTEEKSCPESMKCPSVNLRNSKGMLIYSSDGEVSVGRLKQIILDNIKDRNYEIKKVKQGAIDYQVLTDQDKSMKIYEITNKLFDKEEREDWQKANLAINRKSNIQKEQKRIANDVEKSIKSMSSHQSENASQSQNKKNEERQSSVSDKPVKTSQIASSNPHLTSAQNQINQSQLKQKNKIGSTNDWFQWQLLFVIMIIGLLAGMKYMKQQQDRIGKLIIRNDEDDHLNSNIE